MPFLQINDCKLHYEHNRTRLHSKPPHYTIVLVHGNFASWRWWQSTMHQLSPDYQVYAPDMRGCGDSEHTQNGYNIEQMAADLAVFITELDLREIHLVGHSLGGAIALQYALDQAERIKTLTLLASAPAEGMPYLKDDSLFSNLLGSVDFHQLMRSLAINRPMLKKGMERMMPSMNTDSELFQALVDDAVRMPARALVGFINSLATWHVQDRLLELQLPTLVIAGELDSVVRLDALKRTADALPRSQLVVLPKAGHAIQIEQPELFNHLLLEFIHTKRAHYPPSPPLFANVSLKQRIKLFWRKLFGG